MSTDNLKRGVRALIQVGLAALTTGAATKVWESFNGTHSVDPTVQVIVGGICIGIVAWAQAMLEDRAGAGILVPLDRQVGDAVLGRGVGNKMFTSGTMGKQGRTAIAMMPAYQNTPPSRHGEARY